MKNTTHKAAVLRRIRRVWLLAGLTGLFAISSMAQAQSGGQVGNVKIPLTRPDSRYELVNGATPAGSEVRDKVTGLIWQRCVVGMTWDGATCTGTVSTLTWQNALDAVRTASKSTVSAATFWRVPNHAELYSLAERACSGLTINTTWFPAALNESAWSSSPNAKSNANAWAVNFSNGDDEVAAKTNANRVRLVR